VIAVLAGALVVTATAVVRSGGAVYVDIGTDVSAGANAKAEYVTVGTPQNSSSAHSLVFWKIRSQSPRETWFVAVAGESVNVKLMCQGASTGSCEFGVIMNRSLGMFVTAERQRNVAVALKGALDESSAR
jgi:hypothetical protein